MNIIWQPIKEKLNDIAPQFVEGLNDGATDDKILELENIIGEKLPEDFIESYKIHDGCDEFGMVEAEEFLSIDRIIDEWKVWKDLFDNDEFEVDDYSDDYDNEIDPNYWWNPLWIPITYDGAGNHLCLDLSPTDKGNRGQIIRMWHDDAERKLVATSFKEWITHYKDGLINGQFIYDEEFEAIVDKDDV